MLHLLWRRVSDQTVDEGDTVSFTGSFTDAGSADTHTIGWTFGDGATASSLTPTHAYADNGSDTVTLTVTDDDGASTSDTLTVIVANVAPEITSITAPVEPVKLGTSVSVSAGYTDPGTADTHTATWNWGDGATISGTVNEDTNVVSRITPLCCNGSLYRYFNVK